MMKLSSLASAALLISASAVLLIASTAVAAQNAAQTDIPSSADIVVSAPDSPVDVQSKAHDMVSAITRSTIAGQIARWTEPVCLRVYGVTDATAARVNNHFVAVAQAADVPLARGDCDPNIMVTFTEDAATLVATIAERQPSVVRALDSRERAQLLGGQRPLRWFYRTGVTSARGSTPSASSAALLNSGDYRVDTDAPVTNEYVSSLIRRPTNAQIVGASIIVDMRHARGLSLAALTDYIAMVALSQPRMTDNYAAFDSILALGQPNIATRDMLRLTDWDRAFLGALYAVPADRSASSQRSMVAQAMADRLGSP